MKKSVHYRYTMGESMGFSEDGAEIFCVCNEGQRGRLATLGAGTDGCFYEGVPGYMEKITIGSRSIFFNPKIFTKKFMDGKLSDQQYRRISKTLFDIYVGIL